VYKLLSKSLQEPLFPSNFNGASHEEHVVELALAVHVLQYIGQTRHVPFTS